MDTTLDFAYAGGYHHATGPARPMPLTSTSGRDASDSPHTTLELIERARRGDASSLEALVERCMPSLRRWARGRLPAYARDLNDTQDLVQEAVMRALAQVEAFESRHPGALQAYLRQAVVNRIRDEIRRVKRRPVTGAVDENQPDRSPSPLEHAIGREGLERYESALARLSAADREAIVARIEFQQSYEEIAAALGKPTANAARVAVTRALQRLIVEMDHEH